ncbi:MAG: HNH endonuclease [Chloroflexi bacterium CFX6]|nr:HNH endonuclease [Chloroflexi bacterium CFX6]
MIRVLRLFLLIRRAPRLPRDEWGPLRLSVMARDNWRCQLRRLRGWGPRCGEPATHVDHRVPKAWGGADDLSNLQAACERCNLRKGATPPASWLALRMVRAAVVYTGLAWVVVQGSRADPPAIQGSTAKAEQHAASGGAWAAVVSPEQASVLRPGDPGVYSTRADAERAADAWNGFGGEGTRTWFVVEIER